MCSSCRVHRFVDYIFFFFLPVYHPRADIFQHTTSCSICYPINRYKNQLISIRGIRKRKLGQQGRNNSSERRTAVCAWYCTCSKCEPLNTAVYYSYARVLVPLRAPFSPCTMPMCSVRDGIYQFGRGRLLFRSVHFECQQRLIPTSSPHRPGMRTRPRTSSRTMLYCPRAT